MFVWTLNNRLPTNRSSSYNKTIEFRWILLHFNGKQATNERTNVCTTMRLTYTCLLFYFIFYFCMCRIEYYFTILCISVFFQQHFSICLHHRIRTLANALCVWVVFAAIQYISTHTQPSDRDTGTQYGDGDTNTNTDWEQTPYGHGYVNHYIYVIMMINKCSSVCVRACVRAQTMCAGVPVLWVNSYTHTRALHIKRLIKMRTLKYIE